MERPKADIEAGIAGFKCFIGLSGTVGGALCKNSSCGKYSITDLLIYADYIDEQGNTGHLIKVDFNHSFHTSDFKTRRKKGIITKVYLKECPGSCEKLLAISKENEEQRKRNLGSGAMNLGCTVNRYYINGKMPFRYRVRRSLNTRAFPLFVKAEQTKRNKQKEHILKITGYSDSSPYISNYSMINYIWKDDAADVLFPRYLDFMKNIYWTDKVEIEVLE